MSGELTPVVGPPPPRIRLGFAAGVVLTCSALALGARPALDNVHAVVPGVVFRSAQLSPDRLAALIEAEHVRSVVNLRGAAKGQAWYDEEMATSARLGVRHVDFGLSAVHDVPVPVAEQLVRLMDELPKPLLIHCQAGADRSGLASALYRYAILHDSPSEAGRQLSLFYGHVPLLKSGTASMDRSFSGYVLFHPPANAVGRADGDR